MSQGPNSAKKVRTGLFEIDLASCSLYKEGRKVSLQELPFRVLSLLIECPGNVVTRQELQARLWPGGTYVEFDEGLNTAVKKLRKAFGDSAENPRFIETVPKRGYRFIAPIGTTPVAIPASDAAIPPLRIPDVRAKTTGLRVRDVAIGVALLVSVLAGRYWLRRSQARVASPASRVMIAVLPLQNLTGNPDQEYLGDGLTEEIITELARVDPARMGVIARTSIMKFKSGPPDIKQAGLQLGVTYILEGAVRSGSERLGITVQLIRVSDQTHLWAQEYDLHPDDTLSWERNVAQRTANALSVQLLPDVKKHEASEHVPKPEAREAYLRGRYLLSHANSQRLPEALHEFQKATQTDPEYAEAYSGMASAYYFLGAWGLYPRSEVVPQSKTAALKALALDDSLVDARITLALIRWEYELDFAGAGMDLQNAIETNANSVRAHAMYASYLAAMGNFDEGIKEAQIAVDLDPLSLHVSTDLGRAYLFARKYDLAISQFRKTLELDPNFMRAHSELGMALLEQGQYDEALAEIRAGIGGGVSSRLGYAYARAGKTKEARDQLAAQLKQWGQSHTDGWGIALTYTGLGDKDQAFVWLDKDLENHGPVQMIKAWPYWDSLRSDRRYRDLLRRIGLSP